MANPGWTAKDTEKLWANKSDERKSPRFHEWLD